MKNPNFEDFLWGFWGQDRIWGFIEKNSRIIVLERWWDKSKSVRKWKMGCQCGRSKEDKGLFQKFFQENFYILEHFETN